MAASSPAVGHGKTRKKSAPAFDDDTEFTDVLSTLEQALEAELGEDEVAPFALLDMAQTGSPVVYANGEFKDLIGYLDEEILGQQWFCVCGDDTDIDDLRHLERMVYGTEEASRCIVCYTKDAQHFWNHIYIKPGAPHVMFTCISCHDVSKIVEAREPAVQGWACEDEQSVVEEASRVQRMQVSTVQAVIRILASTVKLQRLGSDNSAASGDGEAHAMIESDKETERLMAAARSAIMDNSYGELREVLLHQGMRACLEMTANFTLKMNEGGKHVVVRVVEASVLHYALCKSAFIAAVALIISSPELIHMLCQWQEDVEFESEGHKVISTVRRLSAVQLANRYASFFHESKGLSQMFCSLASVMQYMDKLRPEYAFMISESGMERLEAAGPDGVSLLINMMQKTSEFIATQDAEYLRHWLPSFNGSSVADKSHAMPHDDLVVQSAATAGAHRRGSLEINSLVMQRRGSTGAPYVDTSSARDADKMHEDQGASDKGMEAKGGREKERVDGREVKDVQAWVNGVREMEERDREERAKQRKDKDCMSMVGNDVMETDDVSNKDHDNSCLHEVDGTNCKCSRNHMSLDKMLMTLDAEDEDSSMGNQMHAPT